MRIFLLSIISANLLKIGYTRINENRVVVDVQGGGIEHIAPLENMQVADPDKNWEMYSNWAESVRSFPKVIKQKVKVK